MNYSNTPLFVDVSIAKSSKTLPFSKSLTKQKKSKEKHKKTTSIYARGRNGQTSNECKAKVKFTKKKKN